MASNLVLLILILIAACGKEVSISTKKLESNSTLSTGTTTQNFQDGLLLRNAKDQIVVGGSTYNVSIYSSYLALEFIAAKKMNSQHQVKFKANYKGSDIILEIIQNK
jgi:hypothetical protein